MATAALEKIECLRDQANRPRPDGTTTAPMPLGLWQRSLPGNRVKFQFRHANTGAKFFSCTLSRLTLAKAETVSKGRGIDFGTLDDGIELALARRQYIAQGQGRAAV